MGRQYLILIRNLQIVYANDSLALADRFARWRQERLGCLCVNVNRRITYSMVQSPCRPTGEGPGVRAVLRFRVRPRFWVLVHTLRAWERGTKKSTKNPS